LSIPEATVASGWGAVKSSKFKVQKKFQVSNPKLHAVFGGLGLGASFELEL
jgi:hypothetical protein